MKTKILLSTTLLATLGMFSTVGAISVNVDANANVNTGGNATSSIQTSVKGNATSSTAQNKVTGNATSSATKSSNNSSAMSSVKSSKGVSAETHGSAVVAVVKALLNVANRDGGIGGEVRLVAQSQNESASTTVKAMTEVENRNFLTKLFFGSDYKNLGQLRSEMVRTQNDINRLENAYDRTADTQVKADLQVQIEALENSRVKLEAFIKANESSFSLLGWLVNRSK